MGNQEFRDLLLSAPEPLSVAVVEKIEKFRELVVDENTRQNLTRLVSPREFYEGHVLDALALLKTGFLRYPALDLGSGLGAPGLLCALISGDSWVLAESEKKKAEFLERARLALFGESGNLQVTATRAEDYLKTKSADTIVARAVGPIDRIYGWIRKCSTWNTLVLLKGPAWEQEWAGFQATGLGKQLKLTDSYNYKVGPEQKTRIIVKISRNPGSR